MAGIISSQTIADYVSGRLDAECMPLVRAAARVDPSVARAINDARAVRWRTEARLLQRPAGVPAASLKT